VPIFGQEATSNLTKLFLAEESFVAEKPILAKKPFLAERPLHTDALETISSGNNLLSH
jgi:hypothetical protein